MKGRILTALLFLGSLGLLRGQGLGSWNIVNVKYNHSDKLSLFAEAQLRSLRFYDHFHYHEVKGGFNYKLHKAVRLSLGAGNYQTYREGGDFVLPKNNNELRVWPQLTLSQEVAGVHVEQRYRLEMRWTSNGYRNRFRYRVGLSHSFGSDRKGYHPLQLSANNELFFTDRAPYFERNRVQAAVSLKPSRSTSFQLGYLHQFDYRINDETGRDFLVLGFYYEWWRRPANSTAPGEELKDD